MNFTIKTFFLISFFCLSFLSCKKENQDVQEDKKEEDKDLNNEVGNEEDIDIISFTISSQKNNLISEDINAEIDLNNNKIDLLIPENIDASALIPSLMLPEGASYTPEGPVDFTKSVTFIITDKEGYTTSYEVHVTKQSLEWLALIAIYKSNTDNKLNWDISNGNLNDWEGVTANNKNHVLELNLESKKIDVLPEEIKNFVHLKKLNLDGNSIEQLPSTLSNLSSTLTYFSLSGSLKLSNPFITTSLIKLKHLNIEGSDFESVPVSIGNLVELEYLNISSPSTGNVSSLPSEIGQLTQLKHLDISFMNYNRFSFPEEFGNLVNLEYLSIRATALNAGLPSTIGNFTKLSVLKVDNCILKSFPKEIGNLKQLDTLIAYQNSITGIPPEIGQLSNLKTLNLKFNSIKSLPSEMSGMSSLESLNLYTNQISDATSLSVIGQMKSLKEVDLGLNYFKSLPIGIGNNTTLESINLKYNHELNSLPSDIGQISRLKNLDIKFTKITSIPKSICSTIETNSGEILRDEDAFCEE